MEHDKRDHIWSRSLSIRIWCVIKNNWDLICRRKKISQPKYRNQFILKRSRIFFWKSTKRNKRDSCPFFVAFLSHSILQRTVLLPLTSYTTPDNFFSTNLIKININLNETLHAFYSDINPKCMLRMKWNIMLHLNEKLFSKKKYY